MITGIGHVAFLISDLDRSLDFYCNKLGFRRAFDLDREGNPIELMQIVTDSPHAAADAKWHIPG